MSEERARQGIEHLHTAALEVIAAARAFLDVAESALRSAEATPPSARPAAVDDLDDLDDFNDMAEAGDEPAAAAGAATEPGPAPGSAPKGRSGAAGRAPRGPVTRIRVS